MGWRGAILIQRHEQEKENLSLLHKEAKDQIEAVRREHAREIAVKMLMGIDSGLLQTCIAAWRSAILIQRHEQEKENLSLLHKEAQDHIQAVKMEHARQVAARLMSGNDSGLLQTCIAAWREAVIVQRHELEKENLSILRQQAQA